MNYEYLFLLTGSLCLTIALVQAWLLVFRFSSEHGLVARWIPGKEQLVKSHIDYLMMSMFLFIFFLLSKAIATPAGWAVIFACLGAFMNPLGFFLRALKPSLLSKPTNGYKAVMTLSFLFTTVGFMAMVFVTVEHCLKAL